MKSPPATRLLGRGSTPSSGVTNRSGTEKRLRLISHLPAISDASWRTMPIGRKKRMTSVPSQKARLKAVRTASCSAKTSATTV